MSKVHARLCRYMWNRSPKPDRRHLRETRDLLDVIELESSHLFSQRKLVWWIGILACRVHSRTSHRYTGVQQTTDIQPVERIPTCSAHTAAQPRTRLEVCGIGCSWSPPLSPFLNLSCSSVRGWTRAMDGSEGESDSRTGLHVFHDMNFRIFDRSSVVESLIGSGIVPSICGTALACAVDAVQQIQVVDQIPTRDCKVNMNTFACLPCTCTNPDPAAGRRFASPPAAA